MGGGGNQIGHLVLTAGAFGGVVDHLCHLGDGAAQLTAGLQHVADQLPLAGDEGVEAAGQITQFVFTVVVQPGVQITASGRDGAEGLRHAAQRLHQAAHQQGHQRQCQQADGTSDQTGAQQCGAGVGIDFVFRHQADQGQAEALQRLGTGQPGFVITLKTHRLAAACGQCVGGVGAGQVTQAAVVIEAGVGVYLDLLIGADQKDHAALAKLKAADQLRQALQAVAQTGDAKGLVLEGDALIDEQRRQTGRLVGVDGSHLILVAVDQCIKPAVCRVVATHHPNLALLGVEVAAFQHGDAGGECILLLLHSVEITREGAHADRILSVSEPVLHQAVAGDGLGG